MSAHALPTQLQVARSALRRHPAGGLIARTAAFNVACTASAAAGGVILARAVGPTVRGEYTAVTAWLGILLVVGELGQSAAVCFYVARDPRQAREYVATAQMITLVTGAIALVAGVLVAPALGRGYPGLAGVYRIAFAGATSVFIGTSYLAALQARSIRLWNLARLSQPLLATVAIIALWLLRMLSLGAAIEVMIATMALQLGYAYCCCRGIRLAPGRMRASLVRPLARYGLSQITAIAPATVNIYLDQLVLSQLVSPADLGRYSVAVSITMIPVPLVSAIGNVAFPRLAAQRTVSAHSRRLQRAAVLTSALVATAIMAPLAVSCYWLIPLVFGPAYRSAVPLLWLLTPGAVFLACVQVIADLLRGLNRPGLVAAAQGVAAVFTLILLITLLPILGVAAAAIASTVAYGVALAVMARLLWRLPHADEAVTRPTEGDPCASGLSGRIRHPSRIRPS